MFYFRSKLSWWWWWKENNGLATVCCLNWTIVLRDRFFVLIFYLLQSRQFFFVDPELRFCNQPSHVSCARWIRQATNIASQFEVIFHNEIAISEDSFGFRIFRFWFSDFCKKTEECEVFECTFLWDRIVDERKNGETIFLCFGLSKGVIFRIDMQNLKFSCEWDTVESVFATPVKLEAMNIVFVCSQRSAGYVWLILFRELELESHAIVVVTDFNWLWFLSVTVDLKCSVNITVGTFGPKNVDWTLILFFASSRNVSPVRCSSWTCVIVWKRRRRKIVPVNLKGKFILEVCWNLLFLLLHLLKAALNWQIIRIKTFLR